MEEEADDACATQYGYPWCGVELQYELNRRFTHKSMFVSPKMMEDKITKQGDFTSDELRKKWRYVLFKGEQKSGVYEKTRCSHDAKTHKINLQ